jgi:hypothetical protein
MTAIIICGAALLVLIWLYITAPRGWQDETGFHYGEEPRP